MKKYNHFKELLEHLCNSGRSFISFNEIEKRSEFDSNCVALRYDIHLRDIQNGMDMLKMEEEICGKISSTSFVMFGLAGSTMLESLTELINSRAYDEYIEKCLALGANIKPHISPINDYLYRYQPVWSKYPEELVAKLLIENYEISETPNGLKINIKHDDVFNLAHINLHLVEFIEEFAWNWKSRFGLDINGFAVHGNGLSLNRLLHNGVLMNQLFMADKFPRYFEVHSSKVRRFLSLYSDCTLPYWMWDKPSFKQDNLQLLVHPAQWNDDKIQKCKAASTQLQISKRHLNYPYAAPLDTIINPIHFINSKLGRYEYGEKIKSCYYE